MIRDNNYVFIRYKVLKYMGDILNIIGMGALVLSNLGMIMDAIDNASGMFIVGLFSLFFSASLGLGLIFGFRRLILPHPCFSSDCPVLF